MAQNEVTSWHFCWDSIFAHQLNGIKFLKCVLGDVQVVSLGGVKEVFVKEDV